jgi:hypothetical protein
MNAKGNKNKGIWAASAGRIVDQTAFSAAQLLQIPLSVAVAAWW